MNSNIDSLLLFRNLLTTQNLPLESSRLNHAFSRLETEEFSILLCGEFSRGKTSLINTILGQEVLATSLLRLPTVNTVNGATVRAGKVTRSGQVLEIPLEEIVNIRDAESVELSWDTMLFQANVKLTEYPSMSEAPDPEAFEKAVAQADLIVVTVAADSLYSHTEATIVDQVIKANGHQRTIFVVNFWDRIAPKDQEEVKQAAWIRLPVNQDRIFFLSSLDALEGNEQAQERVSEFSQALEVAASERLNIKNDRLVQLSKQCLAVLETTLADTNEQISQNQQELAATHQLIQRNLQELKSTRDEIQNNLSELRNSTREVLQAKLSNFIRDLKANIADWAAKYTGDKLDEYLNQQLKQTIREFTKDDFEPYLKQRSEEQSDLLGNGIKRYQNALEHLYKLLPVEFTSIQMIQHSTLSSTQFDIELAADDHTPKKPKIGFDYNKMLQVPESLIILATTALGSMLFRQFAIFIAPIGLLMSGFVSTLRARGTTYKSEDLQPYELQLTEQARRIETAIIKDVTSQMDQVYDTINGPLVETTKTAEQDARTYMQSTQGDSNSIHSALADLTKIRESLGL